MRLVIGGCAQGKLDYVLEKYNLQKGAVWDAVLPNKEGEPNDLVLRDKPVVINHFHLWVRERILAGECPEEETMAFLDVCGDCIIICDEVGNGIVPMEPFEREYRERVGRLLIRLAEQAEEVERVICGIGQKIK
ncbi:MAG: hypothetical protein HDR07_01665 [Lachnospiraceae bacterium]|nr:hypothetical protein [Lachnospiraceae bacterium]